ncbi:uncharacterized protein ATNIH1004_003911 [Aspergillus tanneri]|uniref:Lysine-specific metallo-endopeptidase domain-containing protein n=1 Tax=Aspergillus tanneri TaxID=1220188 RepID=A0A5M9MLY7_9EURO|nr:uncharacterized protein ATNIH1004_003911 [Aspergillus tanneri]KAA8648028.1 hypothetical protein ATNIH1004_003911 [Aspergillus tanneri]
MKGDAAAGTLLHELTHSENILGTAATKDHTFPYVINGKEVTLAAYGTGPIAGLASVKPHLTLNNADTLAYFALGATGHGTSAV